MKNRIVKRLLAGCLAAMLLFGDTAGVLASELLEPVVETEVIETEESTETTEVTENTEMPQSTEVKENVTESSEVMENTEENAVVDEPAVIPEQAQTVVASDYTGPIYQAYFGLPSVLAPSAGTGWNTEWTGDRIIGLGVDTGSVDYYHHTNTWRILSPDLNADSETALLMSDEILMTEEEIYTFDNTYDNNYPANINAILFNYARSELTTGEKKFSDIEQSAMKAIRLLTKDEVMNAAYGFYSEISETIDKTKELNAGDTFYSYLVDSGEDNNQIWVLSSGLMKEYGYLNRGADEGEEEEKYQAFLTETYERGYAAAIELDLDKVFMTMYTDIIGRNPQYDISGESNRTWRLLLHSGNDGFTATVPEEVAYEADIKVNVTALGTGEYDQISMVLADKDGNIVWYDSGRSNDGTTPTTGEFTFTMYPALSTGIYTLKVFAENTTESYVSNVLSSELKIVSASATNLEVAQSYGHVSLTWDLENTNGWYTYCDVYRSDSINGTYTKVNTEAICCNNSNGYGFYTDIVTPAAGEAANPTYYYKVEVVDPSTGVALSERSEPATNAGLYYGIPPHEGYIGAYVVDKNKNKVTSLTLHEGEAVELSVAFVKEDGTIEYLESDDLDGVRWYLHKEYATTDEYRSEEIKVSKDKVGIYPAKVTTTEDGYLEIPSYQVYLQAEEGAIGTYYLTAEIHQGWQNERYWQIPVTVTEAEDGVDYSQRPDIGIVATQEEAEQKLRDFMIARDNTSYVIVTDGVTVGSDSIFDIYAEREGMKPNEGDYLYYHVGYVDQISFFWSAFEESSVSFNGEYYSAYRSTTPFITTAEQEAEVDAYINKLVHTEGGALYQYAHGSATREQQVKAIYDWIIAHVNPNVEGDRRTPIYHTVWHALFGAYGGYPGSSTCEAFALLFTRLSREMGIPSKVIMGTDSAAHTYNIVEVGNKWYFIDTNARVFLSDEDHFKRAQEQAHYLDSRFIANYLSKIPGNDYYVESTGTVTVTGTDGSVSEAYGDLSEAVAYIVEQASKEGNENVEYTLTVSNGDMAFPETSMFFACGEDEYGRTIYCDNRVTIDLGGNSLIIRDALGAGIAAKEVRNGTISVGDDALLYLLNGSDTADSVYKDLRIIYKSTQGAASKTPSIRIMGGSEHKVILEDSVSLGEFYIAELYRNVEIQSDLSVKWYIQMQDGATATDDKITINGTLTVGEECKIYAGIYEVEKLVSMAETIFSAPAETKLIIGEELSLAGYTVWAGDVGAWGEPGTVEVALKRQFRAAEDVVPYKQATINWSGGIFNYGVDYVTAPMFHLVAQDYVNGVLQENKKFPTGTTLGKVTAKGLDIDAWKYNVALTADNMHEYLTAEIADDGDAFLNISGGVLSINEWIVLKTRGVDGKEEVLGKFVSWKEVSDYIGTLANSSMTYVVEFKNDFNPEGTLTLPAKAAGIVFRGVGDAKVSLNYTGELKLGIDATFENMNVGTVKAVSGKNLTLIDAELAASGAVALTGTLFMEDATLDSDSKINVVNIVSNSAGNRILYGGNASSNILTITGVVSAGPDLMDEGVIAVTVKSLANSVAGYEKGVTLMNAAKASAAWFTVNGGATYKSGKVIKYGEVDGGVALHLWDEECGAYIELGEFETFQQAMDEINQLADITAEYRIVLLKDAGDATKAITTPAKAAHLTISSDENGAVRRKLIYKNAITLKSNLTLENIELAPAVAGDSITGNKFDLAFVDCSIEVDGTVKNVGTLKLSNAVLTAGGDISVADVINPSGSAKIVTTAVVTGNNGEITKVAPKLTISGSVFAWDGDIEVELREKTLAGYEVIDFSEEDAICANGIQFAKAEKLSTDTLVLSGIHFAEGTVVTTVKSAGYLAAIVGDAGAALSYVDETGNPVVNKMLNFADAVTEINNLKTKRDYTITLYEAYETAKTIAMPKKNNVSTLTIEGTGDFVELYHNGNITLTSPTILSGVYFKKNGTTENSAPITFSTGGYALTVEGKVYFNTPVNFNGGKKGTLEVTEAGQLYTVTNGNTVSTDAMDNLICGGVMNFAEVRVNEGQSFVISGYETDKPVAGVFNVTTLHNAGIVSVVGTMPGTVKITNVYLNDGRLESNGTIDAVNMTLEGIGDVVVSADAAFNIKGKLICATDKAVLYTRQNAKNVPYLSINGTVTLENPSNKIKVGVYDADGTQLVKLQASSGEANPNAAAQLLTAKTATADKFAPVIGNVGVEAYPEEGGYFLQKTKTGIYVYYANEVAVAVCEGNADTGNLKTADVMGYYASFKDAVAAIDSLKDKTAEYTIVLLEDVNTATAPAAVTLPAQAANVIITSCDDEVYDIYYTGNLSLKAATEFVKVRFNPMNTKKQGTASNIAAGNFDLILRDVEVGTDIAGMKINNLTGSAKQITTLAAENLMIYGGVTGSKGLVIEKSVIIVGAVKATSVTLENGKSEKANILYVDGAFTADELVMQGFTMIDAANTLTIKNILNETTENIGENQTNIIRYGKNSKGAPNLTVKGVVSGTNEIPVIFDYDLGETDSMAYVLKMQDGKYTLSDKQKLATVEKAALSEITFRLNGAELVGAQTAVKANKGVYLTASKENGALLEISNSDGVTTSYCLDYAQAVNEINNIADKSATYTITVGTDGGNVTDTNMTDKNAVSAITLPKKNTAASVTVAATTVTSMAYTGNISYPGALTFENIVLEAQSDSSVTGTKNVSSLTLVNTDTTFKNISNVNSLTLDDANLVTNGTVTVAEVALSGVSEWNALAKTTIIDLDASEMEAGSYIASKQDAKTLIPMFTVNGAVTLNTAGTPVVWKVLTAEATVNNLTEVSKYADTGLVVAPKEDADKFVAWPFASVNIGNNTEGMTLAKLTSYKTIKNEVVNGDKSKMAVRIVQTYTGRDGEAVTYAKSFDEAVTIINNIGDMEASYRMELLQGSLSEPVKTAKNGTEYGKLILPAKAANITIVGANEAGIVAIGYTGTLAINCDTTFDNILLTEGTVQNGEFVETNMITPSYKGAYELTFTDSVRTLPEEATQQVADIVFVSASISKGTLSIEDAEVYATGALTVKGLEIAGASTLITAGKATITNILDGNAANDTDKLTLEQYFTKTTKPSQKSVTQLAINGEIADVDVSVAAYTYECGEGYHGMMADEAGTQKLATMPKASIEQVDWLFDAVDSGENWQEATGNLYKQNGGLYYTTEPVLVRVEAQDAYGKVVYASEFLTWEDAVKEIDKRADKAAEYQLILLESMEEPVKTLTLPSKAGEVTITSETGETNYVLFTGNKITAKCNTNFESVGLFAVKMPKNSTEYSSVAYTINGGNFELGLADMQYELEGYYSMPTTISGKSKGTLTVALGSEANNTLFAVDKISGFGTVNVYNETFDDAIVANQVESVGIVTKGVSGVGMLNVYPGATLVSDGGSVSVKNANVCGGTVMAKDITVSQIATLENAILMAGSQAAKDGKLKLKDIIVKDTYNYLSAEQDKNGKTQINISGTVSAGEYYMGISGESAIVVDLYYNNYSSHAKLSEGMTLINAAKADACWFVPAYTTYDEVADEWIPGMGYEVPGYGLYNTKKEIVYGTLAAED